MDKQMLGIINAGEENRKLKDLVRSRSLSALPVGGRYRTVDFMLSNMVNAGIKNVGLCISIRRIRKCYGWTSWNTWIFKESKRKICIIRTFLCDL